MKSKKVIINNQEVTVHSDGSISKVDFRRNDKRVNRTFGGSRGNGHMQIIIGDKNFAVSRVIARAFLKDFNDETLEVGHKDGNPSNNDVSNLHVFTRIQDVEPPKKDREGRTSSDYRGVSWLSTVRRWKAKCSINGREKVLGLFCTEREAALARDLYAESQGFTREQMNIPEEYAKT